MPPVECKTAGDVLRAVKDLDIRFIRLWFCDVQGMLKSFAITPQQLEGALAEGMGFDGSSIEGFARIEESDIVAFPDPTSFAVIAWRSAGSGLVARMFCDIRNPDGSEYDGDPRTILRRNLKRASDQGYTFYVGPEQEYFYFKDSDSTVTLDQGGYFDLTPLDAGSDLRRETIQAITDMGIEVEYSHHEVGPSQHEIDLAYTDALAMADACMTYRLVVKEVAMKYGVYATFMPKPIFGQNGSGMHTHQSLFKGERNAFFDAKDPYHLSSVAKHYMAGILRHAREICSIICQWVNSYKRLVPGYEAPAYVCWARRNRSAMVRIPMYKPGKEKATRLEFRAPDPACNPYLAFSVMLAAGLDGVDGKYPLPEPVEQDVFDMSAEELRQADIQSMPASLGQAIEISEGSKLVRKALGDHVFRAFIQSKKIEWERYRTQVHEYELKTYLPIL